MATKVTAAQYGKEFVRVLKKHQDPKTGAQSVVEMTVRVLLEGDIDTSYVPHLLNERAPEAADQNGMLT